MNLLKLPFSRNQSGMDTYEVRSMGEHGVGTRSNVIRWSTDEEEDLIKTSKERSA
jgi:hypothetical protein